MDIQNEINMKAKQVAAQEQCQTVSGRAGNSFGQLSNRVLRNLYDRRCKLINELEGVDRAITQAQEESTQKTLNVLQEAGIL